MKDTSSEEFRRECEARHVLKYPKEQRDAYYTGVQKIRGQKAADELVAEVKKQRNLQKEQAGVCL